MIFEWICKSLVPQKFLAIHVYTVKRVHNIYLIFALIKVGNVISPCDHVDNEQPRLYI